MPQVILRSMVAPDSTYTCQGSVLSYAQLDCNMTLFLRNDVDDVACGTLTIPRIIGSVGGTSGNFLFGPSSGSNISTGTDNFFAGLCAGYSNTTGLNNVAIGCLAGFCNITGSSNVAIGDGAGFFNWRSASVYVGSLAGYGMTGFANVAIGSQAGECSTSLNTNCNVLIGLRAGQCIQGSENNIIGYCTGRGSVAGTALYNNIFGSFIANSITSASYNNLLGRQTALTLTTGSCNNVFGYFAGLCLTTGSNNIFMGRTSGANVTTGSHNIMLGNASGAGALGLGTASSHNIFLGNNSGACNQADNNIFAGQCAGYFNATGTDNIAIGREAGLCGKQANGTIAIGALAARNFCSAYDNNIFVGTCSAFNANGATVYESVGIGYQTFACGCNLGWSTAVGYRAGWGNNISVGTATIVSGGTGYTDGVYGDVEFGSTISGTSPVVPPRFNVTVSGGVVTSVTLVSRGAGYTSTSMPTLDVTNVADIGGTGAGLQVLMSSTLGGYLGQNTLIGAFAGCGVGCGSCNVFVGYFAGSNSVCSICTVAVGTTAGTGRNNRATTFIGTQAGNNAHNTCRDVFIGNLAGDAAGGHGFLSQQNVVIGYCAGRYTKQYYNIFIGSATGAFLSSFCASSNIGIGRSAAGSLSTGNYNVFVGDSSGIAATTGQGNVFLGRSAGACTTTGSNNIFAGQLAGQCSVTGDNNIIIGACAGLTLSGGSNNIIFGRDADVSAQTSNTVVLGHTTIKSTKLRGIVEHNMAMIEQATVSATAATGTITYDAMSHSVLWYTLSATGNWTLNIRGDGSNSLDSIMSSGQSLSIAFIVTNGGTAYYQTALQIDGNAITPKWQGGSAPTSGNASSQDVYVISILKTGSATFTVFESQTKFA